MKVINDKKIEYDYYDNEKDQKLIENIELNNCKLQVYFMRADSPNDRILIRNVKLNNCEIEQLMYAREIFEDITINNLITRGVIGTDGSVYKHVILEGKIGEIIIQNMLPIGIDESVIQLFLETNKKYYETVDWAFDISNAEFVDCEIRGIPSRLIKRDPETQVVIKNKDAIEGRWKKLKLKSKFTALSLHDAKEFDDYIIIAPKRSEQFKNMIEDFKLLREEGIVD